MSNLKLTKEEVDDLLDVCLDDSTKIIRYLNEQNIEQTKQSKIDRRISVATLIITIISLMLALIAVIPTIIELVSM